MKKKTFEREFAIQTSCLPYLKGDFPTGIHKCVFCNKSVHLFGCSVKHVNSVDGYRESRTIICLSCFNQSKEDNNEEQYSKEKENSLIGSIVDLPTHTLFHNQDSII